MKRIFDLEYNDFMNFTKHEILTSIKKSEGRTVMSETVISIMPLLDGVSNPETASAFGADMVTLNTFDLNNPFIFGYDDQFNMFGGIGQIGEQLNHKIMENKKDLDYIHKFKSVVGRFIGLNLEPIPKGQPYPEGMKLTKDNLKKAKALGFDYVVVTANPQTNVTNQDIIKGVKTAFDIVGNDMLIIAGKMHGAGEGTYYDDHFIQDLAEAGADIILLPAPGTVMGFDLKQAQNLVKTIHGQGLLAMSTIGTSQEGSSRKTVEDIALLSKQAGVDIQHIGDAGLSGIATPENITALSITIRGVRHTYRQMARSKRR